MEKLKDFDPNKYIKTYRKKHPEKARQWQLNSYANQLTKAGYTVIPPGNSTDS